VFFVNVPLSVLVLVALFVLVPADREREAGRRFDLPGALSVTLGLTLLVFVLRVTPGRVLLDAERSSATHQGRPHAADRRLHSSRRARWRPEWAT
jgi:hypothetical protein